MPTIKVSPQFLPRQKGEVWQGGWFVVPLWIQKEGEAAVKPWLALWVSPHDRVLVAGDLHPKRGSDAELFSLLDEMFEDLKRRPERLEVSEPGLEALLSERVASSEIDVVVRERLAGVEDVLKKLPLAYGAPDYPGSLDVKGVTVESMRRFAEAARTFYQAAPWQHLSPTDLIDVRAAAPPGFRYAVVLGGGGAPPGVCFYDDEREFWHVLSGAALKQRRSQPIWNVTFGTITDLPPADAELWVESALPVAGPGAYPVAVLLQSKSTAKRPSLRTLDYLIGLLEAIATSLPEELDQGHWEKTVATLEGWRQYDLRLPLLLTPPTREELTRRGVPADPRSLERLYFVLSKSTLPDLESPEVLEEFLETKIRGRPIDQIPFEPKDDPDRAQILVFDAYDAWGRLQKKYVDRALALDPSCTDALVLRAELCVDAEEARPFYEKAVAVSKKSLSKKTLKEARGRLWTLVPARAYLRALHGLAHTFESLDKPRESMRYHRLVLELDEDDHQKVRYCLLTVLLENGEFSTAQEHIRAYGNDEESIWAYARALAAFAQYGADSDSSAEAIEDALALNDLAAVRLVDPGASFTNESDLAEDAELCSNFLGQAWSQVPGAMDWLAQCLSDFEG